MKKIKLKLDKYEIGLIINVLVEFRNDLIAECKDYEIVDELILKLCR